MRKSDYMKSRILLFGKGTLAVRIAEFLHRSDNFALVGVIPVNPEPNWTESLSEWARCNEIEIFSFETIFEKFHKGEVTLGISVYFDKIFTSKQIGLFESLINVHNGPLPKYRGVNPINWALKNREMEHGVTVHLIDAGIDTGAILGKVVFSIYPDIEEVQDVYKKCLHYGEILVKDVLSNLNWIEAKPQLDSDGIYYSKSDFEKLGDRKFFFRNPIDKI